MADDLVTRTVFGYEWPETRAIVDALWAEKPHGWYERNWTGRQDPMHEACMAKWREWSSEAGVALGRGFKRDYPTAGANEGIHAVLAHHATHGGRRVHVFAGEYEGYGHIAQAFGLEVCTHPRDAERYPDSIRAAAHAGDLFFLSQPSAIDGNLWDGFDRLRAFLETEISGMKLAVDLTYVGAIPGPSSIDLDHEVITAALWSLSKPFGVYYHRIGGLLTRTDLPALGGARWFKNLFAIFLGERLMSAYPARRLPGKYRAAQQAAVELARSAGALPLTARASDAVILACAPDAGDGEFKEFARDGGLRFCLTGAIDSVVKGV